MSNLFQNLSELHKELAVEHGPFWLFGLFMPEDKAPDRWDLVVSAPWLRENDLDALRLVTKPLQNKLETAELLQLSTVVALSPNEPFVKELDVLVVRGRGLELPGQTPFLESGLYFWRGLGVLVALDWIELPRSIFNNQQFERMVLFWNAPLESATATLAAAAAG